MRRLACTCPRDGRILGSFYYAVHGKRCMNVYNRDNINGSALFGLLLKFVAPSGNTVQVSNEPLTSIPERR